MSFASNIIKIRLFQVRTVLKVTANRNFARWSHRRPSKVYLPSSNLKEDHIIELDPEMLKATRDAILLQNDNLQTSEKRKKKPKNQNIEKNIKSSIIKDVSTIKPTKTINAESYAEEVRKEKRNKIKRRRDTENLKRQTIAVFDENGEIIYEKLKDNSSIISDIMLNVKSKKNRANFGQVMVEGWRMILDGLNAQCKLNTVIFSRVDTLNRLKPHLPKTGVKFYKIPYKEIELWSDVETSSGLIGLFQTPRPEELRRSYSPLPLTVICDNIRVPNNLGAILRAVVGASAEKVYLIKGCVDLWEPKVLRSASGAHFRLPIETSLEWSEIEAKLKPDSTIFIADSNSKILLSNKVHEGGCNLRELHIPVVPYYSIEYGVLKSVVLIIGGETEGISEDSYRFVAAHNGTRLNIPLENGVESLNTGMAAAVIAFEIKKKLVEVKRNEKILLFDGLHHL